MKKAEGTMKKKFLFLLICLIGFLCSYSIGYSEWSNKKIDVLFRDIRIYVNGVKLKTDVEPFIYNGRVFVPVRFISEALNQKVEWDAKNWIVYIGEKTVTSSNENDINQTIVYITKTGTKYHRAGCKYLDKSAISITRGEATKKGYTPCSVCNPP